MRELPAHRSPCMEGVAGCRPPASECSGQGLRWVDVLWAAHAGCPREQAVGKTLQELLDISTAGALVFFVLGSCMAPCGLLSGPQGCTHKSLWPPCFLYLTCLSRPSLCKHTGNMLGAPFASPHIGSLWGSAASGAAPGPLGKSSFSHSQRSIPTQEPEASGDAAGAGAAVASATAALQTSSTLGGSSGNGEKVRSTGGPGEGAAAADPVGQMQTRTTALWQLLGLDAAYGRRFIISGGCGQGSQWAQALMHMQGCARGYCLAWGPACHMPLACAGNTLMHAVRTRRRCDCEGQPCAGWQGAASTRRASRDRRPTASAGRGLRGSPEFTGKARAA